MTSEQLVAAMRERVDSYFDGTWTGPIASAYDVSILLLVIGELKANEQDSIMALRVCGEKIDTYIDRRKEDEKRIAELEAENAKLKADVELAKLHWWKGKR